MEESEVAAMDKKKGKGRGKKSKPAKPAPGRMFVFSPSIKASEYACTGRYPAQASAMFLNELSSLYLSVY